jgi:hypothetical protein
LTCFSVESGKKVQWAGARSQDEVTEVTEELLSEVTSSNNHLAINSAHDQNIRREVYDALSVLKHGI